MKGRVCDVRLAQREESSYGKGGRGIRSYGPATFQILGPPTTRSEPNNKDNARIHYMTLNCDLSTYIQYYVVDYSSTEPNLMELYIPYI